MENHLPMYACLPPNVGSNLVFQNLCRWWRQNNTVNPKEPFTTRPNSGQHTHCQHSTVLLFIYFCFAFGCFPPLSISLDSGSSAKSVFFHCSSLLFFSLTFSVFSQVKYLHKHILKLSKQTCEQFQAKIYTGREMHAVLLWEYFCATLLALFLVYYMVYSHAIYGCRYLLTFRSAKD